MGTRVRRFSSSSCAQTITDTPGGTFTTGPRRSFVRAIKKVIRKISWMARTATQTPKTIDSNTAQIYKCAIHANFARQMKFQLLSTDPNTKARAGVVSTDHGDIPTPIFMPVGTAG